MNDPGETGEDRFARLVKSVRDRLPDKDRAMIAELIDANEFGVALEWIIDAFVEQKLAFSPEELELIETLAKAMKMYPAILDRFHPSPR